MDWKQPPRIKIYEAMGALADNRIQLISPHQAKVESSAGNKTYDVIHDPETQTISANDNGSYWQGYLGYPAIAFLMTKHLLPVNPTLNEKLKGIAWKEINQKHKNDFTKTEQYLYTLVSQLELEKFAQAVLLEIENLHLHKPLKLQQPTRENRP